MRPPVASCRSGDRTLFVPYHVFAQCAWRQGCISTGHVFPGTHHGHGVASVLLAPRAGAVVARRSCVSRCRPLLPRAKSSCHCHHPDRACAARHTMRHTRVQHACTGPLQAGGHPGTDDATGGPRQRPRSPQSSPTADHLLVVVSVSTRLASRGNQESAPHQVPCTPPRGRGPARVVARC